MGVAFLAKSNYAFSLLFRKSKTTKWLVGATYLRTMKRRTTTLARLSVVASTQPYPTLLEVIYLLCHFALSFADVLLHNIEQKKEAIRAAQREGMRVNRHGVFRGADQNCGGV